MFVITGATGNIGKILVLELLSKGKKIRAIARHRDKLQTLAEKGAEIVVGDLYDAAFAKQAFEGASAAFCLIPPKLQSTEFRKEQQLVADNMFEAVKLNNVKHVVLLSSIGAYLRHGAGVVDGLGYMEEKFLTLKNVNVVNLRPGYFMENLFGQISTIKQMNIAGSPIKGNLKMPMVATKDIAQVAFELLNDLKFSGNTIKYVLGPRDVSYNEVISVLGKAIGIPDLKYVQFSYEDAKNGMVQSGFISPNVAELFNGLAEAVNSGAALNAHTRTHENSSPTSIEEFAQVFAQMYKL
jgi:uncharacterized protein YbjT (DUF2867 family)